VTEPSPDLSVIVPLVERPSPLDQLYEEFSAPLRASGRSFEFLFVGYAWHRPLTEPLRRLVARGEPIRLIEVPQAVGETALLKVGGSAARGRVLVTLPAYLQAEASALLPLVERIEGGADLAVVYRWPRRDSVINRAQNSVLHFLVGRLAGGRLHDVACGLRAMRSELLVDVPLYGDFARFLPLLALREGFVVEEVKSAVHPRALRGRVYGPGVYLRRLIDVLGLLFLLKFTDKPLRFFGLIGSVLAMAGGVLLLTVLVQRLGGQSVANRPLLLLGVLLITLGIQSIALGLIGEMIVHLTASQRRRYRVRPVQPQAGRTEAA
jgi:glycosyltransferase involved in cell wall biosynthesis